MEITVDDLIRRVKTNMEELIDESEESIVLSVGISR